MAARPGYQITARNTPSLGPRAIEASFEFSTAVSFTGDFMQELELGHIDPIQSVKIDNSNNPSQFIISFPGLGKHGDTIVAAPYSQGTYPIFVPQGIMHYVASSAGGVRVVCQFFSIELPYSVNSVLSSAPSPSLITGNATSGAVVMTGASIPAFAANAARKRSTIQNPPNNANSVWIKIGGAATADAASQEIPPGAQFDTGNGPLSLQAINIIGTVGQSVFVQEIA